MKLKHKIGALAAVAAMALPMAAQAKGIFIINTGDELFEVKDLPAAEVANYPANTKLGFKCSRFGVFWADVWTWDCQQALVDVAGEKYGDLPPELKSEANYTMSDAKRGLWEHYGIAAVIGGLLLLTFGGRLLGGKKDEASAEA